MNNIHKNELLATLQQCDDENIIADVASVLNLHKKKNILSSELSEKINTAITSVDSGIYIENTIAKERLLKFK